MPTVKFYHLRFTAEDLLPGSGDASKLALAPAYVTISSSIFHSSRGYGYDTRHRDVDQLAYYLVYIDR